MAKADTTDDGLPFHVHKPRDGTAAFRCVSPYCEDLGSSEPMGRPPNYEDDPRYRREEVEDA